MNTSYFFSKKIKPGEMNLVSIAGLTPEFLKDKVHIYKSLHPSRSLVARYHHREVTEEQYTEEYRRVFLDRLDPQEVYADLGPDAVLLCWEKPETFCHRHLVAEWLSKALGIAITEL